MGWRDDIVSDFLAALKEIGVADADCDRLERDVPRTWGGRVAYVCKVFPNSAHDADRTESPLGVSTPPGNPSTPSR